MQQSYPSIPLSIKEVRLLLRRINKSIRILDSELSGTQNQLQIDTESLNQLSDLIYANAQERANNSSSSASASDNFVEEDPSNILNELI